MYLIFFFPQKKVLLDFAMHPKQPFRAQYPQDWPDAEEVGTMQQRLVFEGGAIGKKQLPSADQARAAIDPLLVETDEMVAEFLPAVDDEALVQLWRAACNINVLSLLLQRVMLERCLLELEVVPAAVDAAGPDGPDPVHVRIPPAVAATVAPTPIPVSDVPAYVLSDFTRLFEPSWIPDFPALVSDYKHVAINFQLDYHSIMLAFSRRQRADMFSVDDSGRLQGAAFAKDGPLDPGGCHPLATAVFDLHAVPHLVCPSILFAKFPSPARPS